VTVTIAGKVLIQDGEVLVQAEKVSRRVAADLVHKEMTLLGAMKAGQL
jgi:hypothetical protein